MIVIAIVEDNEKDAKIIENYILKYAAAEKDGITVKIFNDGSEFIEGYAHIYDLIFINIEMQRSNGLITAKHIRKYDKVVNIIFMTNSVKYAINGYEVNALDFMIKPIEQKYFEGRFKKAIQHINDVNRNSTLVINYKSEFYRVFVKDISYIEVDGHLLVYHLIGNSGETILKKCVNTLTNAEKELPQDLFARCNSGVLVNLLYVNELKGNDVKIEGNWLQISRHKKKEFVERLSTL